MDARVYLAIIAVIVVVLAYFLFLSPKSAANVTTSIPISSIPTLNTTASTTTLIPNASQNYSDAASTWVQSRSFPIGIGRTNCIIINNTDYCIGGSTAIYSHNITSTTNLSDSYYSAVGSAGALGWTETIPTYIVPSDCLSYTDQIYCITGRFLSDGLTVNTTFYSYASSSGLSQWNETTKYPVNSFTNGCATSGYLIYCVGGVYGNDTLSSRSFYAPISKKGIGSWSNTTALPVSADPQCYIYSFTIYCLGTYKNSSGISKNYDFYATVTATGIQSWRSTTAAPNTPNYYTCSYYSPFIYCVGGVSADNDSTPVYYTGLSIGGVNGWHEAASYPFQDINSTSCATYNGNTTLCIGGQLADNEFTNSTYYTRSFI